MYCKEQRLVLMLFFSVGMIYILQYGSSNTPAVDTEFRPALLLSHGMALTLLNFYTMRPFFFFRTLAAVALLSVSCSKSDAVDPNDPNAQLPDPSGTITLSMRNANSGTTYLADSNIYIDKADNFTGATFVSLGPVRGLGNVNYIPKTGWVSKIAVVPGEGYVAYSNGTFYRIYVTGYTTNIANEIIGAEVKYQAPFGGLDEAVTVANTTQTFGAGGEVRDIPFTNKGVIPCMVAAEGACTASLIYADDYSFLPIGVRVEVEENWQTSERQGRVIVRATNGKTTEIQVMQQALTPAIWFDPWILTFDYKQATENVAIQFTEGTIFNEIELSCDADWCKVSNPQLTTVTVEVEQNNTGAWRSTTLTARTKDGSLSATMTVGQKALDFSLSQTVFEYDRNAGKQSVTLLPIDCAATAESQDDWCTCSVFSNVIEISVAENTTSQNRSTTVTVSAGGVSRTIEVYQSRYAVGDYYNENNVEGVVYVLTSGFHGGIVSLDETETQWSTETITTKATDKDNGQNNMNTIRGITGWSEKYPAFVWCEAKNTNGMTGWYLPAQSELSMVLDNIYVINSGLAGHGGTTLKTSSYWSSTQSNSLSAYSCYRDGSYTYSTSFEQKTTSNYVRAVRAF